MTGLWVTFEGVDGSGKSTQAEALARWVTGRGRVVTRTREPGGTEVGRLIRGIVLHHRGDVVPRAEALLYAADRAQHVATVVRPALDRGEVVVLDPDQVRSLSLWAADGALPDLTVLLDLDPGAARTRLEADDKPYDRLEAQAPDFHRRVRESYRALARAEPDRFLVVDAAAPQDRIAALVRERIQPLL